MKNMPYFTYLLVFLPLFNFAQGDPPKPCPCCTENHRQFDFWLGSWEVVDSTGKILGMSTITSQQDSCILQENWSSSTSGYTGTSYNFYNTATQSWEQLWLDNQGQRLKLKGGRKDNNMIMFTEMAISQQGNPYVNRITWTKNEEGTVRQLWEVSSNGTTWNTVFNGLYRRLK